ncbi:MAG: GNAT family N-acetyltransferase [Haloarculaceae archaeon]
MPEGPSWTPESGPESPGSSAETIRVREATVPELPDALNVLDGGGLATDAGRLRGAIDRGEVLVAVADGERVVGALALDGERVTAIAVRRRRRDQSIGTALVEVAADRRARLVAEFDSRVRPFWDSLGFDVAPAEEPGRYRGVRG